MFRPNCRSNRLLLGLELARARRAPRRAWLRLSPALLLVRVLDLALRDLFERHRQVVLRARLDERGQELVERAFAELVVVVVDLPGTLRGHDHEGVARVHVVQQFVDAGMDHGSEMLPAAEGAACGAGEKAVRALPVRPDKPGRTASGRLEALGARCGNFSSDDALELVDRAVQLVIDDRVGELAGELALLERLRQALLDLAFAFG